MNENQKPKPPPTPGSVWSHHKNGNIYTVIAIANAEGDRPDHPPEVIYIGGNGKWWTRPLWGWHEKMRPYGS